MGLKLRICKCGHNKDSHKSKKSKLSLTSQCQICPCSSYMNRKRPDKLDKLFTAIVAGMGIFFVTVLTLLIMNADPKLTGTQNETITLTLSELYEMLYFVSAICGIFIFLWLVVDPIIDLIHAKKRRTFPIDENGQ